MPLSLRTISNIGLVVAALAALIILNVRSEDAGVEIVRRDPAPGVDEIRVDVAGAVLRPGVVTALPGERVTDAINRAGGVAADADTTALNLSRRIADEDHIVVPRRGEREALLDLNRATPAQLEALPGVGAVTAAAIVSAREQNGPYRSTDDLLARALVTARVYAQVRDLLTVR
jgi:competence protein ComEA